LFFFYAETPFIFASYSKDNTNRAQNKKNLFFFYAEMPFIFASYSKDNTNDSENIIFNKIFYFDFPLICIKFSRSSMKINSHLVRLIEFLYKILTFINENIFSISSLNRIFTVTLHQNIIDCQKWKRKNSKEPQ